MRFSQIFVVAIAGCLAAGCSQKPVATGNPSTSSSSANVPVVGFVQANSLDPWRQVFNQELMDAAKAHSNEFTVDMKDGGGKSDQQIGAVENMIAQNVAALLISPHESEPLTKVCEQAYDKGIPVVLLDRKIVGDKYSSWIGGDNKKIGAEVAEFIGTKLNGKGTVLMILGVATASATIERRDGAMEVWKAKYPEIKVEFSKPCDYQRNAARNFMENHLTQGRHFDAIYAQNDEMAIGALKALEQAGYAKPRVIVGVDAVQKEIVDLIKDGKIDATFLYPNPGPTAVEVAAKLLMKQPVEKEIVLPTVMVTKDTAGEFEKTHALK